MKPLGVLLCLCLACSVTYSSDVAPDDDYTLQLLDAACDLDTLTVEVIVELDFADGNPLDAYQWTVCHDEDLLTLEEDDIREGEAIEDLTFLFQAVYFYDAIDASGWGVAGIFDVIAGVVLDPVDDAELFVLVYSCEEDTDVETATIDWCGSLGTPVIPVVLAADGEEVCPVTVDAVITLATPEEFLRGDADNDGSVSGLLDALYILDWAFNDGDDIACVDAADVNDSGTLVALLDALDLLQWAFAGDDDPPSPGPDECGPDETDDDLDCETPSDECA